MKLSNAVSLACQIISMSSLEPSSNHDTRAHGHWDISFEDALYLRWAYN